MKIMTGKHRRVEDDGGDEKQEPRRFQNIAFPQRPNSSPRGWGEARDGEPEERGGDDRPLRGRGRV